MSECGSRGPRIGSEGMPICRRVADHYGPHRPAPGDGWGEVTWNDFPPRPAAPDATAGDGLRAAIASALFERDDAAEFTPWAILPDWNRRMWLSDADAVLALPALRDVLAAAARDAEKVRVVRELHTSDQCWYCENRGAANCAVMRALDGTS